MELGTESNLRDLAVRYAIAVDDRDSAAFVSVFAEDAELIVRAPPGSGRSDRTHRGTDEIGRIPQRMLRYERTFHMLGQSDYTIDGDRASGTVYCQAHHLSTGADGGRDLIMYIRYRDRYKDLGKGIWRIASREVDVQWMEERETTNG
jgi:hypothetical protein